MSNPLDLPQLIADVITEVQSAAEARGVHVTATNLAAMPQWVDADEPALRRVLLNVLDVVVGIATDGTITVRLEELDAANHRWTCTAEWLSEDDAPIEAVRCTFVTALPPGGESAVERPLQVLVVDDSPQPRSIVAAYLAGTPHRMTEATGGAEAVDCVRAGSFDIILMDRQMPGMDGLAATRAIREFEAAAGRPRVTIVVLTALGAADNFTEVRAAGADDFLTKPLSRSALFRLLAALPEPVTPAPAPIPEREPAPALPPAQLIAATRQRLAAILSTESEPLVESLRQLGHTLSAAAAGAGLDDIAHLAASLERTAATASPRETVIVARTLQAWLAKGL